MMSQSPALREAAIALPMPTEVTDPKRTVPKGVGSGTIPMCSLSEAMLL